MTRTGFTLEDLGGTLSWASLLHFAQHLGADSALWRSMHADDRDALERAAWADGSMVALVLADLFDQVALLRWNVLCLHSETRPRRPKPYPRPGVGPKVESCGREAVPVAEFDGWWESFDKEVA